MKVMKDMKFGVELFSFLHELMLVVKIFFCFLFTTRSRSSLKNTKSTKKGKRLSLPGANPSLRWGRLF